MKQREYACYIATAALLLAAAVLLLLRQELWAVICAVLACLPLFLLLKLQKQYSAREAAKAAENLSRALSAQQAHHAAELRELKASGVEELEDFRSVLSHQLRMPLSIVQGYADILIKDMVTDEDTKKEYLQKIVDRTQYISEILSTQLSIRRNVDDIAPVFKPVDIIALARRACEDMQTVAKNKGVEIQSVSALDTLTIDADPYQLNKVIFNILENSLKYMGRDGHISILTSADDENALITIRDDGLGLDSEETSHIFELNYQGSNKTSGHGHGLYLVKQATEAHGGSISAQSAPGMGMSIKITLPLRHEAESPEITE